MNVAIIVASGKGARMNVEESKQFLPLLDKPLLSYSIDAFERCSFFENIIVVVNEEEINKCKKLVVEENFKKVTKVVAGGKKRQDSVANGLFFLPPEATIVAIHDG
ncbi:MAG: 2-C-methyl-D-erythritol 4-phosphate cytidylyltransferase, partial [Candidatus Subteraquimicrobiales bacterium]|nr:2-C-methyl-D-erythritol 4-phosphate cytidylyltransferase [Candidatus Subteraquimicrobiales bacterium]